MDRDETVQRDPDSRERAASVPLALVWLPPAGLERSLPLERAVVVGRGETCDLPVDDPALSRAHARFSPGPGFALVVDLGSRNGTFVGGRRASVVEAAPGTVVRAGDTVLFVARRGEAPAGEQAPLAGGASLSAVRRFVARAGPSELRVLLTGESGTGKELCARAIHAASGRTGPFVPVNCAALPGSLAESELFGHVRGAFTGADRARKGLFAAASGGTLFLDEVGDLDVAVQAKLLRVIEDGEVRPIGADRGERVDTRVVAATNRDPGRAVAEGRFRADLLARLCEAEVRLPPLRERLEDLPALCRHLLGRAGRGMSVEADAMEALGLYDWPLNVRELDNALRGAALVAGDRVRLGDLPERIRDLWRRRRAGEDAGAAEPVRVREPEPADLRARVERALGVHGGNVRRAAMALGFGRGRLYRLLERFGLRPEDFRDRGAS